MACYTFLLGSPLQVIKSEYIDAQRILLVVPLEDQRFLETRALLLEHLGRHQEALECAPGLLLFKNFKLV